MQIISEYMEGGALVDYVKDRVEKVGDFALETVNITICVLIFNI